VPQLILTRGTGVGDHAQHGGGAIGVSPQLAAYLERFDAAIADDLNTPVALTVLEDIAALKKVDAGEKLIAIARLDSVLGLDLLALERPALRLRPKTATITEPEIEAIIAQRKQARAEKDFATSDRLRDELAAQGVEAMDGDPLGWDWKPLLPEPQR
jgi:cysteinyl-tRNA synthetase